MTIMILFIKLRRIVLFLSLSRDRDLLLFLFVGGISSLWTSSRTGEELSRGVINNPSTQIAYDQLNSVGLSYM